MPWHPNRGWILGRQSKHSACCLPSALDLFPLVSAQKRMLARPVYWTIRLETYGIAAFELIFVGLKDWSGTESVRDCNGFPPRVLQPSASNMPGIEVVARGPPSLQLSMPRNCNRTCVSCCSMHAVICFYDALGRRLSSPVGTRRVPPHRPGHDLLPMLGARRTP